MLTRAASRDVSSVSRPPAGLYHSRRTVPPRTERHRPQGVLVAVAVLLLLLLLLLLLRRLRLLLLLLQPGVEVVVPVGLLAQRLHAAVLLLPLAVLGHDGAGQRRHVPELDELVVGAAGEEAPVPGGGQLLDGLAHVLPHAAQHAPSVAPVHTMLSLSAAMQSTDSALRAKRSLVAPKPSQLKR
ncbi:hypothetical protein EYF80_040468 [Liparis tanakae]|uniref:Uncharacterized protein n=1 Tax=Liparis tanakae TaxID=230148 RepID=A0A4Z2G8K3_9TELE|nr:hypothetical protein EYF80_040468 [Liparis tanakae]